MHTLPHFLTAKDQSLRARLTLQLALFLLVLPFALTGCRPGADTNKAVVSGSPAKAGNTANPSPAATLPVTAENNNLYGGIEIGSKGVKATVLKVEPSEEGYDAEPLMPLKTVNTTLMSGVAQTGKFSPEAIDDTAKTVKEFYAQMRDQYKVATERIHIIGSSGLRKSDKSEVDNKDELIKKVESATGNEMFFVNADDEVGYSIKGIIPLQYRRTGILVDIGSGNTKGGYREGPEGGDQRYVTINIPYGTVSFTDEINKQGATTGNFAQQAEKLRREKLLPALRQEMGRKPGLINRRRAYLSGGIVWAMTTLLHPANRQAFVKIKQEDIDTFASRARKGDPSLLNPNLSGIKDEKTRKDVEEEIQKINETFTPPNLIAGAELLQAISTEFKLPAKKVYFNRFGSMGWLLKFIEYQAKEEPENAAS